VKFLVALAVIATLVRLTSRGAVFYAQERMGLDGKAFTVYKFRSMYDGAESETGPVWAREDDPRATPIGRWLRRLDLDELPQLWNVLRGDMSLVGPRPPIPYELEKYALWHRRRILEAKPGITGLWQVYGRSRTTFDDMVRLDLRYICQRSLWLDLWILLRTPFAVVRGAGAY